MSASGKIEVFNISHTGYAVKVSNLSNDTGIKRVSFPTWSRKVNYTDRFGRISDQDDLFTYDGVEWGGNWYCTVNISDHNNEHGEFFTDVYVLDNNGQFVYVGGEKIVVPEPPATKQKGGYAVYWWSDFNARRWDKLNRTTTARKTIHDPYSPRGGTVIAGEINQALNTIHEFSFAIPFTHPLYNKMVPFKSIVEVVNLYDGKIEFVGRVLTQTNEMTTDGFAQKVVCEDFLSYLHDSSQWFQKLPNRGAGQYLLEILKVANSQVEYYKRINLMNVTVNSRSDKPFRYIGYESTWDCVRERIINNIGGYLKVYERNTILHVDWTSQIGETKKSPIQIGRNIKSASRELNFDGLATQIMPVGADVQKEQPDEDQSPDVTREQITIWNVNNHSLYLQDDDLVKEFGIIRKPVIWTEIDNPSVLLARGKQYLRNQKIALAKWTISAVERYLIDNRYDKFEIGNKHPIINAPLSGIETLQILEKKIDILNPQSVDLTIGSQSQSLSAYQLQLQEAENSIERLKQNTSTANKEKRLKALKDQLAALKNKPSSAPTAPKAPNPPSPNASADEIAAYDKQYADYLAAKANYDNQLASYNMDEQERARTIKDVEAEIARLQQELNGGN
ncbi:phage tail protein [Streptococcus salivarius]